MRKVMVLGLGLVCFGVMAVAVYAARGLPAAEAGPAVAAPLDQVHFTGFANGFQQPIDIAFTPSVTDTRLFVVERYGAIKLLNAGGGLIGTFLDLTGKVITVGEEEGLLGLAFSPDYATSGRFYVYYIDLAGDIQISRFQVSGNPNVADPTETKLLNIPHPDCENHNGGDLNFGPDGYLYAGTGDGGGYNDDCNHVPSNDNDAQRLNSLLGKLLRLNVTNVPGYTIPPGNPFASLPGARPEIWAFGLRNPWRFSFDQLTGDMYIGDVGQYQYEEVDFQPAGSTGGQNYGWRCYEGFELYVPCDNNGPFVPPVFAYSHDDGRAIVGGFVYRGAAYPLLNGYYFFADDTSGNIWARKRCNGEVTSLGKLLGNEVYPTAWGQSPTGELYLATLGGVIYHFEGAPGSVAPPPAVQTPSYLPQMLGPC